MFDLIMNFATVLSGFSTLAIAVFTFFVLCENRKLRLLGNAPKVVAYFEPHPDGAGGLNIVIANIGTGPAVNVTFDFGEGSEDFKNYNLIINPLVTRSPLTIIPQHSEIKFLFAIGFHLFKAKKGTDINRTLKPFKMLLSWQALGNDKTQQSELVLDVKQFEGLPGMLAKPHLLRISDNLKALNKNLIKLLGEIRDNQLQLLDATSVEDNSRKKVPGDVNSSD